MTTRASLDLGSATAAILSQLMHREAVVREAAISALASVARAGPLPLPLGDSSEADVAGSAVLTRLSVVKQLEAAALAATAAAAADEDAAAAAIAARSGGGSKNQAAATVAILAASGGSSGSAGAEAAITCLGAIASGELTAAARDTSDSIPAVSLAALNALLRLSPNRSESVQFAVGAALVEVCGGAAASGPHALSGSRGSGAGSAALDTVDSGASGAPLPGFSGSVDRSVPSASSSSPLRESSLRLVLTSTLSGPLVSVRASERAAAAVWLLALVHGLGARSVELRGRLNELHAAFSRLLGEKSAFVQVGVRVYVRTLW